MNPEPIGYFGLDPTELSLLGGLLAIMLAALVRALWNWRARTRSEEIDPFRVFPENTVRRQMTPSPLHGLAWAPPASELDDDEPYDPAPPLRASPPAVPAPPTPRPAPHPVAQAPLAPEPRAAWPAPRPATPFPAQRRDLAPPSPGRGYGSVIPLGRRDEVDEASETIRLPTAADGTVQILPGTLVMTQGPEIGREYRFLRIGSQAIPEVSIGRVSGPPYRHIQLSASTVSRMHARIRYMEGSWWIANLSETNPLSLNGKEVRATEEVPLADGDRVQLGEVELSYRHRRP
jgi:hypothetical protein